MGSCQGDVPDWTKCRRAKYACSSHQQTVLHEQKPCIYSMLTQSEEGHTLGVKDWEPLLLLPEPGPARCSCPGCPARAPLLTGAAGGDLLQKVQQNHKAGASYYRSRIYCGPLGEYNIKRST